jgi:small subunit ribosomal protein S7
MSQKKAQFVPSHSDPVKEKFVNYLMKDGKKHVARKILQDALGIIQKKGSANPEKLFEEAIGKLKPSLEVKAKRIGGGVYQIPIEVKPARQLVLAFRWLIAVARQKKGKGMSEKLAEELMNAANDQGAAIKKKEDTHKMAQANKAFAHYARY